MYPYLIEQLAKEHQMGLLRQAAAWRAAHPRSRAGLRRLRQARPGGMRPSLIAQLQEQTPGGAAETREKMLR
jgi:hypothetical protein